MLAGAVSTQSISPYVNKQFDDSRTRDIRRCIERFDGVMRTAGSFPDMRQDEIERFRREMHPSTSGDTLRRLFGVSGGKWLWVDAIDCHIGSYPDGFRYLTRHDGLERFESACQRQLRLLAPEARAAMLSLPEAGEDVRCCQPEVNAVGMIVLKIPEVGFRCPLTTQGMGQGGIQLTRTDATALLNASAGPDGAQTVLRTLQRRTLLELSLRSAYRLMNLAIDDTGSVPPHLDREAFKALLTRLFDWFWDARNGDGANQKVARCFAELGDTLRSARAYELLTQAMSMQAERLRAGSLCRVSISRRQQLLLSLRQAASAEHAARGYDALGVVAAAAALYVEVAKAYESLNEFRYAALAYRAAATNLSRRAGNLEQTKEMLAKAAHHYGASQAELVAQACAECAGICAARDGHAEACALYGVAAYRFAVLNNKEAAQQCAALASDCRIRADLETIEGRLNVADEQTGTGPGASRASD